jgi:hypothetical protein
LRYAIFWIRGSRADSLRRSAAALLVALLTLTPCARAETPPSCPRATGKLTLRQLGGVIIREGQGLGHVRIGADLSDVRRVWGEPHECEPAIDGWRMIYALMRDDTSIVGEGMVAVVMARTSVTALIVIVPAPDGAAAQSLGTSRGLRFGEPLDRARQVYGAPDRDTGDALIYSAGGLAVHTIGGVVGAIAVFAPGAPPRSLTP